MKKLLYITVRIPFGKGEEFILTEIQALKDLGVELLIVPRNPPPDIFHQEGKRLVSDTHTVGLFSLTILGGMLACLLLRGRASLRTLWDVVRYSRNGQIVAKNLAVLPKALYLSRILRRANIRHIHVHWAGTTATMGYVVSRLTGIPWSFTAHNWDIREDNMLMEKVRAASFVRVISERGKQQILARIANKGAEKIKVIHMGVALPKTRAAVVHQPAGDPVVANVAYLVEFKGHTYLLQACDLLAKRGFCFQCWIIGDGPLMTTLRRSAEAFGLDRRVRFWGLLPHQEVLRFFEGGKIQVYVHSSIQTPGGAEEGIPVSLMEALSFGVPVVATDCGGTRELVKHNFNGLLVPPADPNALADAIQSLLQDPQKRVQFGKNGLEVIESGFNVDKTSYELYETIERETHEARRSDERGRNLPRQTGALA